MITGTLAFLFFFVVVFYSFIMNKYVWPLIATGIWITCQGCIVYNIMEKPKAYQTLKDKSGKITGYNYFMQSTHGQYKYEGFIYAAACCLLGLLFMSLFQVPKYTDNKIIQRVVLFVIIAAIIALWMMLEGICEHKY